MNQQAVVSTLRLIYPQWCAPPHVKSLFTTRVGGNSHGPFSSLNLATHVGDELSAVKANRGKLQSAAGRHVRAHWLDQVHGNRVARINSPGHETVADAATTRVPFVACSVLVADCCPILLTDIHGSQIAAAHAGWRGLHAGIVPNTVASFASPANQILAWVGPCIGLHAYTVDAKLQEHFRRTMPGSMRFFHEIGGLLHMDLRGLCVQQLYDSGVTKVFSSDICVFSEKSRFFSYRRDGSTGRMVAMIWIEP